LHPLDDESKFHGVIAIPPIPIDQQSLVALFFLAARGRLGPALRQPTGRTCRSSTGAARGRGT
jgi:hypothetical protein